LRKEKHQRKRQKKNTAKTAKKSEKKTEKKTAKKSEKKSAKKSTKKSPKREGGKYVELPTKEIRIVMKLKKIRDGKAPRPIMLHKYEQKGLKKAILKLIPNAENGNKLDNTSRWDFGQNQTNHRI